MLDIEKDGMPITGLGKFCIVTTAVVLAAMLGWGFVEAVAKLLILIGL